MGNYSYAPEKNISAEEKYGRKKHKVTKTKAKYAKPKFHIGIGGVLSIISILIIISTHVLTYSGSFFFDLFAGNSVNYAGDFLYSQNDDGVYINYYRGLRSNVIIPSKIEGESVTKIQIGAFCHTSYTIKNVTIPDGVIYIGYYAFRDCVKLKSITIPDSVIFIDNEAFPNCTALTVICPLNSYAYNFCIGNNIKVQTTG